MKELVGPNYQSVRLSFKSLSLASHILTKINISILQIKEAWLTPSQFRYFHRHLKKIKVKIWLPLKTHDTCKV